MNAFDLRESTESAINYLKSVESNARTYANDFPIVIQTGQNAKVTDSNGNTYLDCLAGAGTLALGHNNPIILEKMKKFLESGHILHGLDLSTPIKKEFVQILLECFPKEFSSNAKIQFCGPTGADAVEAAIKLFKTYTKRSTIIAFHGAYHGMSHGALAMTGNLNAKKGIHSLMPDVHFMPYPYLFRCPFGIGNESSIDVSLNYIRNVLSDSASGITKPAVFIMEIVQGEGGCIPADDRWVKGVREITHEFDIPLIIDEVQTGLGRTGYMFAFESSGIIPDAVLVSKAVGGGLPLSVLLYNKKYDVWQPGAHAGTFRGNQLAMVAGIATIEYIKANSIVKECREKGEYLLKKLQELKNNYLIVGDVRGKGLMIGIEFVDIGKPKDKLGRYLGSGEMTSSIKKNCLKQGLIVESGGRDNSVLRLLPPLTITYKEIDQLIDIINNSVKIENETCMLNMKRHSA